MTSELRETLEGLEKRVADRTEELRLQNAELGALHETTLGVMHRLDIGDLLRELLARACELLGTHARIPVHPEPGRRGAREPRRDRRLRGGARRAHVTRRRAGRPRLAIGRSRWWSTSYDSLGGADATPSRASASAHSWASRCSRAPTRSATLGVARDASDERPFGASEVERLQRFAQLASIALDNARLFAAAQRGPCGGRRRERREEHLPRHHQPRDPHAHERVLGMTSLLLRH